MDSKMFKIDIFFSTYLNKNYVLDKQRSFTMHRETFSSVLLKHFSTHALRAKCEKTLRARSIL